MTDVVERRIGWLRCREFGYGSDKVPPRRTGELDRIRADSGRRKNSMEERWITSSFQKLLTAGPKLHSKSSLVVCPSTTSRSGKGCEPSDVGGKKLSEIEEGEPSYITKGEMGGKRAMRRGKGKEKFRSERERRRKLIGDLDLECRT